jgi:acyl carrier protein
VGLAAEFARRAGIQSIPPEQGVQLLGALMEQETPQVGVAPIAWTKFRQQLPAGREFPLLSEMLSRVALKKRSRSLVQRLEKASISDRSNILKAHIQDEIETVIGVKPQAQQSFFDMGMDSLMSIQLSSRLAASLGTSLSAALVMEYPTVESLAEYLARSVLGWESSPEPFVDLHPVSRDNDIPLHFTQQRIGRYHQLYPDECVYNLSLHFRLAGKLDVAALRQSFDEIIRRHEILRTTFPVVNGSLVQKIAPPSAVNMSFADLQSLPEKEQSEQVARLAQEDTQRPFDLVNGPLLRATLIRLGEESHTLGLCLHHIIMDVRSIGIFLKELGLLYNAFVSGQPSPLPDLPIQYADFAHWQHQSLTPEALEARRNYWGEWLAEEPPPLELPTDRLLPPVETFQSGSGQSHFSPDLIQELGTLSQQAGTTLFTTILAAFATLLYRYNGSKEIVVGVPFAGRNHHQLEPLIGVFSNGTFPRRIGFGGNPGFLELLERVRQVNLSALANCDVPLEHLLKTLQPKRNLRQNPLCRVLLNLLPGRPWEELQLSGLTVTPLRTEDLIRRDLILNVWEEGTSLQGGWRYKRDLFDADTIAQMAENFQALLEAIVANPEQSVDEFPLFVRRE